MSRKQKKTLVRILISGALFAGAFFIPVEGIWKLGVYLIPYFVIGWDVFVEGCPQYFPWPGVR